MNSPSHAREVAVALMRRGILAKDTHDYTIRFTLPLVIEEADLLDAAATIVEAIERLADDDASQPPQG